MASHLISITKIIVILLSLFLMIKPTKAQTILNGTISPNCPGTCGNVTIPYPFGIGIDCAVNSTFLINCDNRSFPNKPFLNFFNFEVFGIAPLNVRVNIPPDSILPIGISNNFEGSLFWTLNGDCPGHCGSNAGCHPFSSLRQPMARQYICGCDEGYEGNPYLPNGCQGWDLLCGSLLLDSFRSFIDPFKRFFKSGFDEDIDECGRPGVCHGIGFNCQNTIGGYTCSQRKKSRAPIIGIAIGASLGGILLLIGSSWMFKVFKKIKKARLKKKLFKRNGGLLLQQQLASGEDGTVEKTKLFTSKELEKATDHYNEDRILGKGGQGTVYKGMLKDGRIVAIKMSKTVDEENLEQFINEVVILSQIIHRNVVKLHGCCLETEVPLLVYEFIPNGTLSQYIYNQNEEFPLSWNVRLRIATEVASALSYLHCAASFPIYHRDMKSTNILLDDKYRAKIADFGTSRSIAIDQTHLTTRVLGTFGYLDPEYFQTGQFTEKSDVYSFGVVLVELLTGQQPVSSTRSEESRSLATYFIVAMEENNLFEILDARVEKEDSTEEILEVAKLAKRCLSLDVRKRPTMKEVAAELDGIRMSSTGALKIKPHYEEVEYVKQYVSGPLKNTSSSTFSYIDNNVILDVQPLIPK